MVGIPKTLLSFMPRLRSRTLSFFASLTSGILCLAGAVHAEVSFEKEVWPLLEKSCVECHRAAYEEAGRTKKPKGGLRLDAAWAILAGGEGGKVVEPGAPDKSDLLARTMLPEDEDDFMPPKGTKWTDADKDIVRRWIAEGAGFGGWEGSAEGKPVEKEVAGALGESWMQAHYDGLLQGIVAADEAAIAKVTEAGGRVTPLAIENPLLAVDFIVERDQTTDEKVAAISAIREQLTHLDLSRTAITDAGLAPLRGMPRLTRVDLHATKIGDEGLKHLVELPNLTYLNLYDTQVSDAGLAYLSQLTKLRNVYLGKSQATEQGIKRLQKELPGTEVNWK